jgi:uncharacterized membrane protein
MNNKNANYINAILMILTLIGISVVYKGLDANIPTHWGLDGTVDKSGPKSTLYLLYSILLGINVLLIIISKIDPKKENFKVFERTYSIFRVVFNIFFIAIISIMILAAKGNSSFNTTTAVLFSVSLLLAIIGNYLPKFKSNYSAGIRTPWTLASNNVWSKTHRMAGPIWVLGGTILAITSILLPMSIKMIVFIIGVLIMSLIPVVYSYIEFQKEKR